MSTMENVLTWRGQALRGSDGEKLGTIEEIYLDSDTNEPEWALVATGLFGNKQSFVPLHDASAADGGVTVPFGKEQVKDAPRIDPDGELSQREEAELYRHYGVEYSEARSFEGAPPIGNDVSGPETDNAMTRSEEELRVGTSERETGRVRLRKHIVTDEVQQTVPVKREEVRIEREPITDANRDAAMSGGELTEEEHEVVLHAEQPVVEKRTVPKERVRLDKDVQVEDHTVTEDVRREEIDVDGDAPAR
ncbi:MAG: hypothetical protein QOF17_227 [Solirubrobacteraceae bacterium]|jgi:uncharacterized protein (TIGR02271 family)|nr:hypothetical protein [Solirubrobacteraceae bacterium]